MRHEASGMRHETGDREAELKEMDCGCEGAKKGTQPWIRSVPELWHGGPNGQIAELPNEDLVARGRGCGAGWLFASGSSRAAGWGGFVIGSVAAAGKGTGVCAWVGSRLVGRVRCGHLFLRPSGTRVGGRCVLLVARMPGAASLHQWQHSAAPTGPGGGRWEGGVGGDGFWL